MPDNRLCIAGTMVPVMARVDVAVAGAGFGGLALALDLANRGLRVLVAEPRIMPGWEVGALLRPWLEAPAGAADLPLLRGWLATGSRPAEGHELALIPDVMKRGLEDAVLGAGVILRYACPAVGLVHEDGRIAGLVVGAKSGRHAVLSRCVVDATDRAVLGRLVRPGAFAPAAGGASARRTLEFTGVGPAGVPAVRAAPLPEGVRVAGVHQGHAGPGHLLLELAFTSLPPETGLANRMAAEVEARRVSLNVAERLVLSVPGWSRARLAHGSWELHRLPPSLRAPEAPGALAPGLMVLSAAVAASPEDGTDWLDPVGAARHGAACGSTVQAIVRSSADPLPERCEGRCAPDGGGGGPAAVSRAASPDGGPRVRMRAEAVPVHAAVQVLVAGGGTGGATAAAVSAGAGVRTLVAEMNWGLGGTGTVGGVDSYWFGRRGGFTAEVDRRVKAVSTRLGIPAGAKWNVEAKMQALLDWTVEAGCESLFGTVAVAALMDHARVAGALVATPDGLRAVTADVTIDGSGDGDLAAAAGAPFTYGSARDRLPMWYLLAPVTAPGVLQNGFTSAMDVGRPDDYTRAVLAGRRLWPGHDHAAYLAPRETRHIRGDVTLGVTDHVLLTKHPDTINLCFSNCDIKGRSSADWVGFGVLPPNADLEIPYRAVVPEGVDGLLIAGKAYSCTHDFLATARMQADMQNQGGAIALAAVQAVRRGVAPRAVDVPALQAELEARGVLPPGLAGRTVTRVSALEPAVVRSLLASLTGEEPFHLEQGFDDRITEPLVIVRLCAAGPAALPAIRASREGATGRRRLLLARILAWHGCPDGVPDIVEAILGLLAGHALPPIAWRYRYAGVPPDNGVMPEACHLLHALALVPDERMLAVLDRMVALYDPPVDDFRDRMKGVYYYADEIATAAERWGDRRAVPALSLLAGRGALRGREVVSLEPDFIMDRLAYLELAVARALARCGDPAGAATLVRYLGDARHLFAAHARSELAVVADTDLGADPGPWTGWLAAQGGPLTPRPWTTRID